MADKDINKIYDKAETEIVKVCGFSPIICVDIKLRKKYCIFSSYGFYILSQTKRK